MINRADRPRSHHVHGGDNSGALAAGRLGARLSTDKLQRWFAYLVFVVAAFVIVQVILNPGAA